MPVITPNLGLTKPDVGGSSDVWGTMLNADLDIVDALFAIGGAHTVVRTDASGRITGVGLTLTDADGTARLIHWQTAGVERWSLGASNEAESTGDVGSNFVLTRNHNDGSVIDAPLSFSRATGIGVFSQTPKVGANDIFHQGNLPAGTFTEPVGTVKMFAGNAVPAGGFYMFCDGSPISRTTFSALFAVVGTLYGGGDGSTTFNLPDLTERIVVGKSTVRGRIPQYDATSIGNAFGVGVHQLVTTELPSHNHPITDPGHTHGLTYHNANNNPATGTGGVVDRINPTSEATAIQTASKVTGITIANAGGDQGHDNVQPSLVMNYIIRVK